MTLMTIKQVAEQLNVSPQTIYGLCQKKMLRHVRVGVGRGAIRISEDDLAAYIEQRTVEGAEAETKAPTSRIAVRLKHLEA